MRTTTFDFSPLFRTAVGFDRLTRMLDSAAQYSDGDLSYPPYNIEQTDDDRYRVTMAVAGFKPTEVEVVLTENSLTIKSEPEGEEKSNWIYKGIARRAFERRFQLADHIKVENADMSDGLLTIDLAREVPEEKKPRRIPIASAALLEDEAA
jgi:molecular chaperone IbpA